MKRLCWSILILIAIKLDEWIDFLSFKLKVFIFNTIERIIDNHEQG